MKTYRRDTQMPEVIFPDKVLEIGERQLNLLQAKGIVTRTRNGEGWQGTNSMEALQAMIEDPSSFVCDFCGDNAAVYEYLTEDFVMGVSKIGPVKTVHDSIGSWVACDKCAKLFESGDHDALAQRATRGALDDIPDEHKDIARVAVEEMARGLHLNFRKAWSGKRRRIGFE